jgi:hypothetical protein
MIKIIAYVHAEDLLNFLKDKETINLDRLHPNHIFSKLAELVKAKKNYLYNYYT